MDRKGADQEFKGIYEIEGDTLRLCYVYSSGNNAQRPSSLRSYQVPDTTMVSLVMRRLNSNPDRPQSNEGTRVSTPDRIPSRQEAPPVGRWIERRPDTPGGDRIRTFKPGGTLVFELPRLGKSVIGSWRRDGEVIYFSHPGTGENEPPTKEKRFTISGANAKEMTIFMLGERRYTWFRQAETGVQPH